jgi:hypothetical protein
MGEQRLQAAMQADISAPSGQPPSHAETLDEEQADSVGKSALHRRVATTLFFESCGGKTDKSAHLPELCFAAGDPDTETTLTHTAVQNLERRCYFLRPVGADGWRFGHVPTLKKVHADRKRTCAGLEAARARGRKGGRKPTAPNDPRIQTAKKMHAGCPPVPAHPFIPCSRAFKKVENLSNQMVDESCDTVASQMIPGKATGSGRPVVHLASDHQFRHLHSLAVGDFQPAHELPQDGLRPARRRASISSAVFGAEKPSAANVMDVKEVFET